MADQKRNQQNRGQQQSSQDSQGSPRRDNNRDVQQPQGNRSPRDEALRDDEQEGMGSTGRGRSTREPSSVAHDRLRDSDRRSVGEERESDELGSELERESGISDSDEEDTFGTGRSNR